MKWVLSPIMFLIGAFVAFMFDEATHSELPAMVIPKTGGRIICNDDGNLTVEGIFIYNLTMNLTNDPCGLFFQNDQSDTLAYLGFEYGQIVPPLTDKQRASTTRVLNSRMVLSPQKGE